MTQTDFELFKEHYIIKDFEFLYGAWFYTVKGIFDDYINKYAEIKMNSKGAIRQIAKLFLNNLYGKLATSDDSSYKIIKLENEQTQKFLQNDDNFYIVWTNIRSFFIAYSSFMIY